MGEADPLQRIETDRLYTRPHTAAHYWCGPFNSIFQCGKTPFSIPQA